MSVHIIIDSASDLTREEAESRGLTFLPLKIQIDGTTYLDGVTISHEEFYDRLARCSDVPHTSQLTPFDFQTAFEDAFAGTDSDDAALVDVEADEVLVITISGKLSGTSQSAQTAANESPNHHRIHIVDSRSVTVGERILIEYAVRLRDRGSSAREIAAELERVKDRICVLAVVDTLEYLYKGGRLSKASAIAGSLLKIKPVLTIRNGELVVLGKARGSRQSNNYLNEAIEKHGGIDFAMPLSLAYSGNDDASLRAYIEDSRALWAHDITDIPLSVVGATVGTHAGPGLIAVAFFAKDGCEKIG